MSKLLKWAVVAALLIALIIKLSLWLSVRSIMNDAIVRLAPIMDISYGGITSSFDGRVGLEKLKVQVPRAGDSVTIEHAELRFKGLGDLLRFKESLAEGSFPKQLALSLKGIALQVHGPFMRQLYDQPAPRSLFTAMSEVACGKVRHIGTDELLEMGYRTFETDAELSYRFVPGANQLVLDLSADTRDTGVLKLALSLANMSDKPGDLIVNPPRVTHILFEMNDNQYQRKVQALCAGRLRQSAEVYLQTAIDQFDRVMRSQRIALEPALLQAYGRYLKDPQSLRVEFAPSESMSWQGLEFYQAKDVVAMLHPQVMVNREVVQSVGFEWFDPNQAKTYGATEMITSEQQPKEAPRASAQYEFVKVTDLPQYAGKRLQFITYDGAYYQGILRKVQNGKAFISVQMGTGSAETFLRLEKINKVRVML
ncbi:hypothetical protein [Pseudomonas sp. RIT-PI-AD]|uniref:hypothetical protein n=1 Tax=Pseudomonas sp. RIT-PI-AD TaxID=3035294 RepID=UPI0021D80E7B|nr:hypothetical protein [Pseudomonas sp. RIT-PI-AD]